MPNFVKAPYFWMGLGAVSSGGSGILVWRIYESKYPTVHRRLSSEDYSFSVSPFDLRVNQWTGQYGDQLDDGGSGRCFSSFFPKVEAIKHTFEQKEIQLSESSTVLKIIAPPSNASAGYSQGCSIMGISYNYVNDAAQNFVFRSEITVKNDNVGLSLWAIGQYHKTPDSGESYWFKYSLIALEKDNQGDWEIKGGYSWKDSKVTSYYYDQKKKRTGGPAFKIAVPGEESWIDTSKTRKLPKDKFDKHYFGLWESESGGRGKEVFQDIQIWDTQRENAEWLGRENMTNFSSSDYGYKSAEYEYLNKKWQSYNHKQENGGGWNWLFVDVTSFLESWYKPFRGQKGHWRKVHDYCDDESWNRNIKETDDKLTTIKKFCYKKI